MRLEPLYRVTFTTPESWSVELEGTTGTEGQSFLIAEGRSEGRLSARYRAANFPRRRNGRRAHARLPRRAGDRRRRDRSWSPGTDWRAPAPTGRTSWSAASRTRHDDERYRWLNDRVGAVSGEVRSRAGGDGFDVVIDVAELVWEPAT